MVDWRYLWSAFLEKFLARSETRNHGFQGLKFQIWPKIENFQSRVGAQGVAAPKFFFAKIVYRVTWPKRKKFGVGARTLGPESAKMVENAGFRGFWIYPFFTKIQVAGLGVSGAGWKFSKKNVKYYVTFQKKKQPTFHNIILPNFKILKQHSAATLASQSTQTQWFSSLSYYRLYQWPIN